MFSNESPDIYWIYFAGSINIKENYMQCSNMKSVITLLLPLCSFYFHAYLKQTA